MFRGQKYKKKKENGNGRKLRIFLNFLPFSFAYSIKLYLCHYNKVVTLKM